MLKDASKRRFDVVMAWAIDRLGRSLIDLLGTIQGLEASGIDLFLEQQAIDTTTPAGKLMFQVTGAFAEFERSMIRQRVNAGLRRAKEQGKRLGRPTIASATERRIQSHLRKGTGILKAASICGVGTGPRYSASRLKWRCEPLRRKVKSHGNILARDPDWRGPGSIACGKFSQSGFVSKSRK